MQEPWAYDEVVPDEQVSADLSWFTVFQDYMDQEHALAAFSHAVMRCRRI